LTKIPALSIAPSIKKGQGFLLIVLFNFQKSVEKIMVWSFLGIIKHGAAHFPLSFVSSKRFCFPCS